MKFRTSPLLAVAALLAVSAAAPAMAGDFDMGGIPVVRARPVVAGSSNSLDAANVAAGIGNTADQDIDAKQAGGFARFSQPIGRRGGGRVMPQGGPGPGIGLGAGSSNSLDAANVAAGIGNEADQDIDAKQAGGFARFSPPIGRRGGGRVMPQGGPGPSIGLGAVTNNLSALNLAAGIDNQASQTIHSKQK